MLHTWHSQYDTFGPNFAFKAALMFRICSPDSDQDAESNLLCTTTSLNTTLENIRQGTSEKMTLDGQEEDGWMRSKMEGSDETNEEVKDAPAEAGSHAGNLAEIQEVTVGDVQLAGRSSTYELSVLEMEAEESSRNRFVKIFLVVSCNHLDLCVTSPVPAVVSVDLRHRKSQFQNFVSPSALTACTYHHPHRHPYKTAFCTATK